MSDQIASLKKYIESNLDESGDFWEYIIRHDVIDFISNLDQKDSENFSIEILNWNENILYRLADEILFSKNEYIDKDYLYCFIFLKTYDTEYLDYLSQNLFSCFNDLNLEKIPLDFFLQMKEKIERFYIIKNGKENVNDFTRSLNDIINQKMKKI
ncbi:hypothetical protein [Flavobacterium sp. LC2016-01]|uniref:hypothetical protein n=1 Tax=Flavobacterium sp. LC2016-01 TaxID=2675876 RepID=UPI0012BA5734|nr:hypothetical protein [Flavobacterium sp. LC2016-01]MTH17796.1 hypothetical protein [Flavobacterium sp. LC2016-01]